MRLETVNENDAESVEEILFTDFKNDSDIVTSKFNEQISKENLACLKPTCWLNDKVCMNK
jgi:hypothetical protein